MTTITLDVYPTAVEQDAPLIVPEEPGTDEEYSDMHGAQSSTNSEPVSRSVSQAKLAKWKMVVAKWVATAYGYASKKKSLYVPQKVIILIILKVLVLKESILCGLVVINI